MKIPLVGLRLCSIGMTLALASHQAMAELPSHPAVHTFEPTTEEAHAPDGSLQNVMAGESVAIRNSTAMVGMPGIGKVAIYQRTVAGWTRTGSIAAPEADGEFGRLLVYRDNTVVVGGQSAAYVFKLNNGVWQFRQKLTSGAQDQFARFPRTIKYQDNLVVAGHPLNDAPGAVYVFELTSAGKFVRRLRLRANDAQPNDRFGANVAMSTGTIVVGAPESNGGAAYIFKRSGTNWVQTQRLIGANSYNESFGSAVGINKGIIVVGAPAEDIENDELETGYPVAGGAVFVFRPNSAGVYSEAQRIRPTSSEFQNFYSFGQQVDMFGDRLVVRAEELLPVSIYAEQYVISYRLGTGPATPIGAVTLEWEVGDIGIANNWLLVGQPANANCRWEGCVGQATLFDLNRVQ